ncbi:DUF4145 domain-containing protein [Mycobacterium interjectum]|uniref:DUF4145 domain-containing protein n=1 Tax=Mycobacterium interjectum TaxID=33895 RepID=UPI00083296F2|nr:DUF4145 domain-containing protein [Mycobacterium interjectum]MCV7091639.1 DUF4145 domain-containing protein [Mycobacterium interjectum]
MAGIHKDLYLVGGYAQFDVNDDSTSVRKPCAFCGGDQMIVVGRTQPTAGVNQRPPTRWLRCVSCYRGHVDNDGTTSPGVRPFDIPDVLTGDDLAAWTEALGCLSVGANTAAVMMCRKLLFHIAVAHKLPPKDGSGHAPTFAKALKHLEDEGVITKLMRPWVDKIKDVGNEANHEIPSTTSEQAMDVAEFTRQLIRLAYELPAMVAEHAPAEADSTETS